MFYFYLIIYFIYFFLGGGGVGVGEGVSNSHNGGPQEAQCLSVRHLCSSKRRASDCSG